ncbi:MAG: hypothetical protein A2840_02185 [Candidatus Buchananbacteria bacterium RIFCSPHIGHO2_01_FULL_47_11b]|uniref:Uncharacterized protein n=1 Tax=Candidatus Buchananbacteria bacterium RIFCSPHIGHO2_01_FULL_47_11b TaxID=1797537 RepID=A0A1G1Y8I2_9BACT|nr:MAG: hypothetical protein A2840_02185 [Candidatus Buchananbacteria bacterium RIFCSPHIGHO2_01_FULL_47_11b]
MAFSGYSSFIFMDIRIPYQLGESTLTILRRCSYHSFTDPNTGVSSYTRRLSHDYYPRFHIYEKEHDGAKYLSLHLDQKKPSYPGSHAHSGEYDSDIVQQEASRILAAISQYESSHGNQGQTATKQPESKNFFARFFNR